MNSERLLLDFDEAALEFFSAPGGFIGATAKTVGTTKLKHVFDVFETDIFKKAPDGGIGLVLINGKLVEADEAI